MTPILLAFRLCSYFYYFWIFQSGYGQFFLLSGYGKIFPSKDKTPAISGIITGHQYAQCCAFISVIELPRIPAYCPNFDIFFHNLQVLCVFCSWFCTSLSFPDTYLVPQTSLLCVYYLTYSASLSFVLFRSFVFRISFVLQKFFLLYISILLYFPALRLPLWQHSTLFAYSFILCFIKHTAKSMFCNYYSTFCTVVNRIRSTNHPPTQLKISSIFPHQLPVQTSVHAVHLPAFQCPAHMYLSYEGSPYPLLRPDSHLRL